MGEKIFPREILSKLLKWIERREIYAIKGPRQSGKTTILKIMEKELLRKGVWKDKIVFLNFEDPDVLERFSLNPKEYIASFLLESGRYYFLMDEYHYVKDGGKKLKLLYDTFEDAKFIITGSSSLEIAGLMAKFLVGRVFFFELFPFNFYEFLTASDARLAKIYWKRNKLIRDFILNGRNFEVKEDIFVSELLLPFQEYLIWGGYPAVIKVKDFETKRMILKGIYDTYISKDVIEFLRVTDAFKYRCVVRSVGVLIGELVKYEDIATTCQSYYKEVRYILSALSETYILQLLHPFYTNPLTEIRKLSKIYFFDLGLRNYVVNNFSSIGERVDVSKLVENAIFLSLRNGFAEHTLNYWRTIAKAEVDFVLRVGNELIPIEVKYKPFKRPKISRSLRSFIQTYRPKRALVVTRDFWGRVKVNKTEVKLIPACYF